MRFLLIKYHLPQIKLLYFIDFGTPVIHPEEQVMKIAVIAQLSLSDACVAESFAKTRLMIVTTDPTQLFASAI